MNKTFSPFSLLLVLFISLSNPLFAAYRSPTWSKNGMAATPHPEATNAATKILSEGGNAVDAAVAAVFALAVVEPYHSGLGGGEFAVFRLAKEGKTYALDAREVAPSGASSDMYVNPLSGKVDSEKSWKGGLAVGVPGSVAGRIELIDKYGKLPLAKVIQPSIDLAEKGFVVDSYLARMVKNNQDRIAESDARDLFLRKNIPIAQGELLIQSTLANTLRSIAKDKGKSFYQGPIADAISSSCISTGGIITKNDLSSYKVIWREPVKFDYHGYTIFSMPPPSSGGVCLALILNILEGFPLSYLEQGGTESIHLIASAFEHAFADRSHWLGDPDFQPLPAYGMASQKYADEKRKSIDRNHRNPVETYGEPWLYEDFSNTSHVSVIDKDGNMCAITTSINTGFGSYVYVKEGGFFLNSTMDDFATAPQEPNKFDLIGGDVNSIAPGKRPLSSMSPTIVLKEDKPYISLGSVGGPRIITSVAQMLINIIDYNMDVQAAMDAPRIHMQWKPDKLYCERHLPQEILNVLRAKGWNIKQEGYWSLSQAVMLDTATGEYFGASDSRGVGTSGSPE